VSSPLVAAGVAMRTQAREEGRRCETPLLIQRDAGSATPQCSHILQAVENNLMNHCRSLQLLERHCVKFISSTGRISSAAHCWLAPPTGARQRVCTVPHCPVHAVPFSLYFFHTVVFALYFSHCTFHTVLFTLYFSHCTVLARARTAAVGVPRLAQSARAAAAAAAAAAGEASVGARRRRGRGPWRAPAGAAAAAVFA
jgi:hypothetical protein